MSATATINLTDVAAQWRASRRLYPIYAAITREFELGAPCRELESPINRSEPEVLQSVKRWFELMDERIQVFQLRQVLQTTHMADEENLRALCMRYLRKTKKIDSVRDKVDFLLVQYFAHRAPADPHNSQVPFAHVADVLEPLLDGIHDAPPAKCDELDGLLREMDSCKRLEHLLQRQLIEKVRAFKTALSLDYYEPAALVAITRFNFLFRLGFFRLMHADLHGVRHTLHQLEQRGVETADCSIAGLSSE